METFLNMTAVAAPLGRDNVDTEVIIPINRLVSHKRGELGIYCFEPLRYDADGAPRQSFPPNDPKFKGARILVAGANFGCGSSREAAVWALWDMGFRCIIAKSFGDIFRNNCFQNGLLAIDLSGDAVDLLVKEISVADEPVLSVDLTQCSITTVTKRQFKFYIPPGTREMLLKGVDEIDITLSQLGDISAFEARDAFERPWVYVLGDK